MQYATFEVRLEGKMINTIIRHNCTPAEVEILKEIHGPEGLEPICITEERKTQSEAELERLRSIYHTKVGIEAIARLYPGSRPNLPANFSEVGYRDMPHKNDTAAKDFAKPGMSVERAREIIEATQVLEREQAEAAAAGKELAKEAPKETPVIKATVTKNPPPIRRGAPQRFEEEIKIEYPPEEDEKQTA